MAFNFHFSPSTAMPSTISPPTVFPSTTPEHIIAFQFSSWYLRFAAQSIKSTIVRPLSQDFLDYLNADGVFMPEGAEDVSVSSFHNSQDSNLEHGIVQQRAPCLMMKMKTTKATTSPGAPSLSPSSTPRSAKPSQSTAPSSRS